MSNAPILPRFLQNLRNQPSQTPDNVAETQDIIIDVEEEPPKPQVPRAVKFNYIILGFVIVCLFLLIIWLLMKGEKNTVPDNLIKVKQQKEREAHYNVVNNVDEEKLKSYANLDIDVPVKENLKMKTPVKSTKSVEISGFRKLDESKKSNKLYDADSDSENEDDNDKNENANDNVENKSKDESDKKEDSSDINIDDLIN